MLQHHDRSNLFQASDDTCLRVPLATFINLRPCCMRTSDFQLTMKISHLMHLGSFCVLCDVCCYSTICCWPSQGLEAALRVLLPDVSGNPTSGPLSNMQGHPNAESTSTSGAQNIEAGAVLLSARSHEVHHQFLFKQRMILNDLSGCNVSQHVISSSSSH